MKKKTLAGFTIVELILWTGFATFMGVAIAQLSKLTGKTEAQLRMSDFFIKTEHAADRLQEDLREGNPLSLPPENTAPTISEITFQKTTYDPVSQTSHSNTYRYYYDSGNLKRDETINGMTQTQIILENMLAPNAAAPLVQLDPNISRMLTIMIASQIPNRDAHYAIRRVAVRT